MPVMAAQAFLGYTQTVEGNVGSRWYPAGDGIDLVEQAAISCAKELFGFPAANVQPHSATQVNQAVYLSVLKPCPQFLR